MGINLFVLLHTNSYEFSPPGSPGQLAHSQCITHHWGPPSQVAVQFGQELGLPFYTISGSRPPKQGCSLHSHRVVGSGRMWRKASQTPAQTGPPPEEEGPGSAQQFMSGPANQRMGKGNSQLLWHRTELIIQSGTNQIVPISTACPTWILIIVSMYYYLLHSFC